MKDYYHLDVAYYIDKEDYTTRKTNTTYPEIIRIETACGEDHTVAGGVFLQNVTCPLCKESKIYKEREIVFEVGYDGDLLKWEKYWDIEILKPIEGE